MTTEKYKLKRSLISWTAEVAADWWAERLEKGDKARFKGFLTQAIVMRLVERGLCIVECDYDPKDILLEAVRAAGVECSGRGCSAQGILPWKTDMVIRPGSIDPTGRGFPTMPIYIAHDVGFGDDKTVTVVARIDQGRMTVLQIEED